MANTPHDLKLLYEIKWFDGTSFDLWKLLDKINDQPQVINLSPYVLLECAFCDSSPDEEWLLCNSTIRVDKVSISETVDA